MANAFCPSACKIALAMTANDEGRRDARLGPQTEYGEAAEASRFARLDSAETLSASLKLVTVLISDGGSWME